MTRLLLITAVEAEAEAVRAAAAGAWAGAGAGAGAGVGAGVTVVAVGAGPAAAAAGTARLLAAGDYDGVVSAGIAGGFPRRAAIGDLVIGTRSVAADLGAESPGGFRPIEELGFGTSAYDADPGLVTAWRTAVPTAIPGEILTLSTVTGTAVTADRLAERHPGAVAEAMEGFGVATAAAALGVPFVEVRAISNLIGPRDRAAWRLGQAFAALTEALTMWADRQSGVRVPEADSR